jgi:hypothetical protein
LITKYLDVKNMKKTFCVYDLKYVASLPVFFSSLLVDSATFFVIDCELKICVLRGCNMIILRRCNFYISISDRISIIVCPQLSDALLGYRIPAGRAGVWIRHRDLNPTALGAMISETAAYIRTDSVARRVRSDRQCSSSRHGGLMGSQ